MKTKNPFIMFIHLVLLIATGMLAIKIASRVMYDYKFIVDGILSLALIYLAYLHNFSSKRETAENKTLNDMLFEYPENIKGFFFTFFGTLILYWAVTEGNCSREIWLKQERQDRRTHQLHQFLKGVLAVAFRSVQDSG